MKRIFLLVLFLSLLAVEAQAQVGYFTRTDCDSITTPIDGGTICTQTSTVGGRTIGHLYIRRAGAWVDVDTSGSGAAADLTYITQTCAAGLSAEQCLSALSTGILKSTTTTGVVSTAVAGTDYQHPTGSGAGLTALNAAALGSGTVPTARLGTGTANNTTFLRGDNAWATPAGAGTLTSIATTTPITGGPITTTGTIACPTCTVAASALVANQIVTGGGGQALQTVGSLGTSVQVLHGNASGSPTWGAVSLTADVTGTLPIAVGGTNLTAALDDNIMVGSGTTWLSRALPDCDDTGGNHLNYDTTTNVFSCGSSGGGGGGSSAFSAITTGTNTAATMTVGTGGLMVFTDASSLRATSPRITTSILDTNGLAILNLTPETSAVNRFAINNTATGAPSTLALTAAGSDTNINAAIVPKGTGVVCLGSNCTGIPVGAAEVGSVKIYGSTSGVITLVGQAAAGTYNYQLPITAGTTGQCLISGGGGATAMTWGACGGAAAFSAITAATNTTAAMVVGSGASITRSGTGIIDASLVDGVAVAPIFNGKTVDPASTDNTATGHPTGTMWTRINVTPDRSWLKTDEAAGVAVWTELTNVADTDTLDSVFDRGKIIDGANSLANAVRIGDGTTPMCHYTDATLGPQMRPCTDSDTAVVIPTNFNWKLWDIEAGAAVLTVDPDAASTRAMYTFGTAYKPKKSVWVGAGALYGDGTQCPAAPSTVTIGSGAPRSTFICTDNDGSSLYGEISMPKSWDGLTITFGHHYIQTAANTGVLNGDIAASCRLAAATINNTWGTEVAIDDAAVTGTNALDITESAAVTPNGTCTAGSSRILQFRYQLDAAGTTTTIASLHHLGFMIEYSVTSLSD